MVLYEAKFKYCTDNGAWRQIRGTRPGPNRASFRNGPVVWLHFTESDGQRVPHILTIPGHQRFVIQGMLVKIMFSTFTNKSICAAFLNFKLLLTKFLLCNKESFPDN